MKLKRMRKARERKARTGRDNKGKGGETEAGDGRKGENRALKKGGESAERVMTDGPSWENKKDRNGG
jgi:hypothetical protein